MSTISDLLEKHGITQTELARRFGIPLRTVQNWAEGKREPSGWVLKLLDIALSK